MTTTTSTSSEEEAEAASQQHIQINSDLTLTLAIPTTHNSYATVSLTGTWLWSSSLLLMHYLSAHIPLSSIIGKSVLELGAGYFGLPGLTAARLGVRHVTLTDIPDIVPFLSQNVGKNLVINEVGVLEVRGLIWGEEVGEHGNDIQGDYVIVLMSDVFYDMEVMEMIGRTNAKQCVQGENVNVGYNRVETEDLGVSDSAGERRVQVSRECLGAVMSFGLVWKVLPVRILLFTSSRRRGETTK